MEGQDDARRGPRGFTPSSRPWISPYLKVTYPFAAFVGWPGSMDLPDGNMRSAYFRLFRF
jgi:hypothetical protein